MSADKNKKQKNICIPVHVTAFNSDINCTVTKPNSMYLYTHVCCLPSLMHHIDIRQKPKLFITCSIYIKPHDMFEINPSSDSGDDFIKIWMEGMNWMGV